MATTLYIVRHGETEENAQGLFQGQTHGHLSARGKEQALELRATLANLEFDAVLCSDLKRCTDTAAIALHGKKCTIEKEPLLRERDLGNLTGTPIKGAVLNDTVESVDSLEKRAVEFVEKVKKLYAGKKVLAFSHGFFCRVLQAAVNGVTHNDIPLLDNCEVRKLVIRHIADRQKSI